MAEANGDPYLRGRYLPHALARTNGDGGGERCCTSWKHSTDCGSRKYAASSRVANSGGGSDDTTGDTNYIR